MVSNKDWGSPYGRVANMLDCNIVVSKFKIQSCNYIHFSVNTLRRGMNFLILATG